MQEGKGPETPAQSALRLGDEFPNNPEKSGKRLAELGRLKGYHVILPVVNTLWDSCTKQEDREILAFLRQPEWEWRQWADDPDVCIAGLYQDGEYVPVGFYATGEKEDGVFSTLDLEGSPEQLQYVAGAVEDPRPDVKPRLLIQDGGYFFVLVGRLQELLRAGYDRTQVILTRGKGYLHKHEAYVVRSGPLSADKAREEKITHCITHRA